MERLDGRDLLIRELKEDISKLHIQIEQLNIKHNDELGRLQQKLTNINSEYDEEKNRLEHEKRQIEVERDEISYCLEETRKSFSYKLGYALTALPRKLRKKK